MKIRDIEDLRIGSHLLLLSTLSAMHSKLPLMCGRKPTTVGSAHVPSSAFASRVACVESPRMTRPHCVGYAFMLTVSDVEVCGSGYRFTRPHQNIRARSAMLSVYSFKSGSGFTRLIHYYPRYTEIMRKR